MYIDLHSDTVMKYIDGGSLYNGNKSKINLKKLLENKNKGQFLAVFLPENYNIFNREIKSDKEYLKIALNIIANSINDNSELKHTKNYREYIENLENNKLSIFTSIEDGRIIETIEDIAYLKNMGISLITLLWNNENSLGYPNSYNKEIMNKPLKDFGIEVVNELNNKNIIIDISHLNYGGARDVLKYSKYPVVASHSNSNIICPHKRNLPDELIRELGNKGGIIGLTLCPPFVCENKENILSYLKLHLKHILNIGGEDILAIGTDYDGIGDEENLPNPKDISNWLISLKDILTPRQIEKLSYKNFQRLLKETT